MQLCPAGCKGPPCDSKYPLTLTSLSSHFLSDAYPWRLPASCLTRSCCFLVNTAQSTETDTAASQDSAYQKIWFSCIVRANELNMTLPLFAVVVFALSHGGSVPAAVPETLTWAEVSWMVVWSDSREKFLLSLWNVCCDFSNSWALQIHCICTLSRSILHLLISQFLKVQVSNCIFLPIYCQLCGNCQRCLTGGL